jgi:hypothetical protein
MSDFNVSACSHIHQFDNGSALESTLFMMASKAFFLSSARSLSNDFGHFILGNLFDINWHMI